MSEYIMSINNLGIYKGNLWNKRNQLKKIIEAIKDNSTKNNVTIFCIDELKKRLQKEYKVALKFEFLFM